MQGCQPGAHAHQPPCLAPVTAPRIAFLGQVPRRPGSLRCHGAWGEPIRQPRRWWRGHSTNPSTSRWWVHSCGTGPMSRPGSALAQTCSASMTSARAPRVGPRAQVFVSPLDVEPARKAVDEGLPEPFGDWPVHYGWDGVPVSHHVTVDRLGHWLSGQLGIEVTGGRRLTPRRSPGVVPGQAGLLGRGYRGSVTAKCRCRPRTNIGARPRSPPGTRSLSGSAPGAGVELG